MGNFTATPHGAQTDAQPDVTHLNGHAPDQNDPSIVLYDPLELDWLLSCAHNPTEAHKQLTHEPTPIFSHLECEAVDLSFRSAARIGPPVRQLATLALKTILDDSTRYNSIACELLFSGLYATKPHKHKPANCLKKLLQRQEMPAAPGKKSQADLLLEIGRTEATIFHNKTDDYFATVEKRFTHRLTAQSFRAWLSRRHFELTGKPCNNSAAIQGTIDTLRGLYCDSEGEAFTRIAATTKVIYYDLGDKTGQVVEITADGWRIVESAPVPFVRPKGMLAQVPPERGGSIELLKNLINVKPADFRLVVGFLIAFFQPQGPRPHLAQIAEQGTGKTANTVTVRSILDPNAAPTRREPKDDRDAFIAAQNSALIAYDNLSHLAQWLSDVLCCFATGAGYGTRAHYTNDEEVIFNLRRPVIFNAITDVATRPDLLERTILIELPLLSKSARMRESELEKLFQKYRPLILGVLFDAVAVGLKNFDSTRPNELARMADFEAWVESCAPAFGWQPGEFSNIYEENQKISIDIAAEASPLVGVIEEWIHNRGSDYEGTPSDLWSFLNARAGEDEKKSRDWPRDAASMGRILKRLAPVLRQRGINVENTRKSNERLWRISLPS